ncbi:MAG TPA: serine hydrolase domain-containing protein, partial [Flavobacterium sp.]|nr:serine hydrolase domain-containing protein [Flavobacterium sp.]
MNRSLFCFFFVLCALGCSKKDRTPADPKSSPSPFAVHMPKVLSSYKKEHIPYIEEFYNRTWERNHTSGSFLVAKNGEILFEKYSGYGRIETESKIDRDTPLHIASMSKVLTAAVVLRLIDEGKLRLDQDVSTVLNPFPYPGVTVEMLLCHRSGIPYYAWFGDDQKIWDHAKPMKNHDVLDLLNQHKFSLNFYSGRRFAYCNTNYVLLALIIEKVTGMD